MFTPAEIQALVALAARARTNARAPYSGLAVGAVAVSEDRRVFHGCNVENASLGLTLCAERAAMAAAVGMGAGPIIAIVVLADLPEPPWPCGACLQWLAELGRPDSLVIGANAAGKQRAARLSDLLREPFRL